MDCSVFPCVICDLLDGERCVADAMKRDVNDIPDCPLYATTDKAQSETPKKDKPDIGHWVVRQPDGLFCYYDEDTGTIKKRDMTLDEVILYREITYVMSHQHAEDDTRLQVEYQPVRWEDITR